MRSLQDIGRKLALLLLGLIALTGLGLRFFHLEADPAPAGYIYNTDESHYSYNTRNHLISGHWFLDDARYAVITPLFSLVQLGVAGLGPGPESITTYRLASAICGILSCVLAALFFRDRRLRLIALALSAAAYMEVYYSRLGIPEMLMVLLLQATVLLVGQAFAQGNRLAAAAAGTLAVAAAMAEPTAAVPALIVLLGPFVFLPRSKYLTRYSLGAAAGVAGALLLWALTVALPSWSSWKIMMERATFVGRSSISLGSGTFGFLGNFLLSPALETIPFLWPLALFWCFGTFLPTWRRGEHELVDGLVFLWIMAGMVTLGLSAYQPARWQLLIFPPVMYAALRYLSRPHRPMVAWLAVLTAFVLFVLSSVFTAHRYLPGGLAFSPFGGAFDSRGLALAVGAVFVLAYLGSLALRMADRQRIGCAVIAAEICVQAFLHVTYTWPSYFKESQWTAITRDVKTLSARGNVAFSGDVVQDLALRARVRVLPVYYVLPMPTDEGIRDFFLRQNCTPSFFLLEDVSRPSWWNQAPAFVRSLEEIGRYPLLLGDIGGQVVHLYRFKSYEWLVGPASGNRRD